MRNARAVTMAGAGLCLFAAVAQAEVFVYPKPGQPQQQFQQDQFDCHNWAQQQTGVNPMQQSAVVAPAPEYGGGVRGAAGGAALGAIGGAIGGNAGKGAAIGAGVGGAVGMVRQGRRNQQAAEAAQQAQMAQQQNLARYDQAYATCMGGRGYQVR